MTRTVGEVEGFVNMLLAACESRKVNDQLEKLLAMPDEKRRATVHAWVSDLLIAKAPAEFVQAIACLLDDRVAEKAYEVIYECRRPRESTIRRLARMFRDLVSVLRVASVVAIGARLAPMLPVAFIVVIGAWAIRPEKPFVELQADDLLSAHSSALKEYGDLWWAGALKSLRTLCGSARPSPPGGYHFVVYVTSRGGIIQIDMRPGANVELERALREVAAPPFTPEQKADRAKVLGTKALSLSGRFSVDKDSCYAQRTTRR